jgi:L-seryl-tRNA(Ser) seleniumtransferase
VEIGGSFRMPEIIEQSGARLMEVGCTNKTRLSDYEAAIGEETAAILRCHTSNYRIVGFSETPDLSELRKLASEKGLLLLDDLGSGFALGSQIPDMPAEPRIQDSVEAGADLVTFSGDKMLGGPQAGIVLGRTEWVRLLRSHPLARALRVDKLTLAALEATLRLHVEGRQEEIPAIACLSRPLAELKRVAGVWKKAFGDAIVEPGTTEVGGGSFPGVGIPTYRVGLRADDPERLAGGLRAHKPPIVGRIEKGFVWLDPRTVDRAEARIVATALRELRPN